MITKKRQLHKKKHREPKKPIQIYGALNDKTPNNENNNNNHYRVTIVTIIIIV